MIILMLSLMTGIFMNARAEARISVLRLEEDQQDGSTAATGTRTTTRVLRIAASMNASFTQLFPCLNDIIGSELTLPPSRKSVRHLSYTSLPCAPEPSACFRAVYDGYENLLDLPGEEQAERLRSAVESLIVPKEKSIDMLSGKRPPILIRSLLRTKTFDAENTRRGYEDYGQLHDDYFQSPDYVYTAILYGAPSDDLLGGETVVIDAIDGPSSANGTNEDDASIGGERQNQRTQGTKAQDAETG